MKVNENPVENQVTKKKHSKTSTIIASGLVLLGGAALITAGIQAYLTDTDTVTNTFTVGEVIVETLEPHYPGNGSDEVRDLVPNQEIPKDPQFKNSGKNKAIIFAEVEIPMKNVITAQENGERNPQENTELFGFRTNDGGFNSINPEWELLRTRYLDENDGVVTDKEAAVKCARLYGYKLQVAEDQTTTSIFDVVRLANVIEGMIDNSTQDLKITSYSIQADNIADLTTADYNEEMSQDQLTKIYNVYFAQSKDVIADEADYNGQSTLIDTTLNVTMTIENTHLKLNTGDENDTITAANVSVAYTGKGEAPAAVFESSNPEVATVDAAGNIKAVSVGNTIITASATNPATGKVASATVTVQVRDVNAGEK